MTSHEALPPESQARVIAFWEDAAPHLEDVSVDQLRALAAWCLERAEALEAAGS